MAKSKRLITVTAGRLVYGVCYTQAKSMDSPKARAAKCKCSSLARQKLNFTAAWRKLQLLLAANFCKHDLYITFGFSDANLPPNRREAKKLIQKFFDRLRAQRRADGNELKYAYAIHELQDDGSRRLHFHLVVNATPGKRDYETIRSLWTWGDNIEILQVSECPYYYNDDFLELAQYLTRERNPEAPLTAVGDKGFVCSRNLTKPERDSQLVDDNVTICAPPGAIILDSDAKDNEFGSFRYLCYLLPEQTAIPSRRAVIKKE